MFAVHHRPLFYGDSCHRAAGMEEHGLLMHVAGNANVHGAENVAQWAQYPHPATRVDKQLEN